MMSIFSSLRYCLGDPASMGNLWAALAFMPFGLFFDFMDGKVARWRKKSSLMGQELDSLADLVCCYFSLNQYTIARACTNMCSKRFPLVFLQLSQLSPLACVHQSITCF